MTLQQKEEYFSHKLQWYDFGKTSISSELKWFNKASRGDLISQFHPKCISSPFWKALLNVSIMHSLVTGCTAGALRHDIELIWATLLRQDLGYMQPLISRKTFCARTKGEVFHDNDRSAPVYLHLLLEPYCFVKSSSLIYDKRTCFEPTKHCCISCCIVFRLKVHL